MIRLRTEPVGSINRALNESQESEDHPVLHAYDLAFGHVESYDGIRGSRTVSH
jgi:hypothetical protein